MTTSECHECGSDISKPAVTVHRGTAPDVQFCTTDCHSNWAFGRAVENMKRDVEQITDTDPGRDPDRITRK